MATRPNFVLITVDSLRADRLGCYGYRRSTSPRLDQFASHAILFRNAFANGPNTPHAFPAIMAARSALASTQLGLFDVPATLAEHLQDAGYRTVAFNAANPYVSKSFKYDRGFDEFQDYMDYEIDKNDFGMQPAGELVASPGLPLEHYIVSEESVRQKAELEKQINQDVLLSIRDLAHDSFFLWVHYMDSHFPYVPQADAQMQVNNRVIPKVENLHLNQRVRENGAISPETLNKLNLLYDATVRQVDQKVDTLLRALKMNGVYDNSLILFTADHGEEFHEHGDLQHKSKFFDELLHVPFLLKLPGQRNREQRSDLVSHLQLAPTLLSACGIGHSFRHGNFLTENSGKMIFAAASYGPDNGTPVDRNMFRIDRMPKRYCLRSLNWKVIVDDHSAVLLNLMEDPAERQNKARENPVRLRELSLALSDLRAYLERAALGSRIGGVLKTLSQRTTTGWAADER